MWQMIAILIMTCGSVFLMWLGEQIDEYGIGNGISLLIMAGIVAMMPGALMNLLSNASYELTGFRSGKIGLEKIIMLILMFVGVVVGVVFITLGQRRIPTQSAKHVRGRRVYGGTRQYMPLRVNQAGVMPIIFAQSLLMIPPFLFYLFGKQWRKLVQPSDGRLWKRARGSEVDGLQPDLHRNDLFLLLLLDGDHV